MASDALRERVFQDLENSVANGYGEEDATLSSYTLACNIVDTTDIMDRFACFAGMDACQAALFIEPLVVEWRNRNA